MSRDKGTNYQESHSCIDLAPLQGLCQPPAHGGCNIIYSDVWKYECKKDQYFHLCSRLLFLLQARAVKCHRSGPNITMSATKPTQSTDCPCIQTTSPLILIARWLILAEENGVPIKLLKITTRNIRLRERGGGGFPHTKALTSWLCSNYISWGSRSGKFSRKRGEAGWWVREGGGTSCSAGITAVSSPLERKYECWYLINRPGKEQTLELLHSFIMSLIHEFKCFVPSFIPSVEG